MTTLAKAIRVGAAAGALAMVASVVSVAPAQALFVPLGGLGSVQLLGSKVAEVKLPPLAATPTVATVTVPGVAKVVLLGGYGTSVSVP